jgi:hypothetical protein
MPILWRIVGLLALLLGSAAVGWYVHWLLNAA